VHATNLYKIFEKKVVHFL